jgi:hypothetical protein
VLQFGLFGIFYGTWWDGAAKAVNKLGIVLLWCIYIMMHIYIYIYIFDAKVVSKLVLVV